MSADNFERRFNVKRIGENLYSDGVNDYIPLGRTGELRQVQSSNQARGNNTLGRQGAGKVILTFAGTLLALGTGIYALSQNDETNSTDRFDQGNGLPQTSNINEISSDTESINLKGYKEVSKFNGVEIFTKGFSKIAVIDLKKGSKIVPVLASSSENNDNPNSPWFDTWSLEQFRKISPQSVMIVSGSNFGIQDGKNSKYDKNGNLKVQLNYPQKVNGNAIRGWANPNNNYKDEWRALVSNKDEYQILQINSNDDIDLILSQNEIVISGLSVNAKKDPKNDVVRTMIGLKKIENKIVSLVGFGTQEQVIREMEDLGFKRDEIIMMDGASPSTAGYMSEKYKKFIELVDSDKRDTPMVLAIIP